VGIVKARIMHLSGDDVNESRREVDRVYEIYRRGSHFPPDELTEAKKGGEHGNEETQVHEEA